MNTAYNPAYQITCHRLIHLATIVPVLFGALTLTGWMLDIEPLKSILPGLATMKPVTAVGFILLGLALGLMSRADSSRPQYTRAARGCAGLVGFMGAGTLAAYIGSFNIGLDTWLFPNAVLQTNDPYPGRMSAATALGFILFALCILLLNTTSKSGRRPAQFIALIGIIHGLIPLLGYVYGVQTLYQFNVYSSIALHTALLFSIYGVGILCVHLDTGLMATVTSRRPGGIMARWALLAILTIPLLLGWLTLLGEHIGWYGATLGMALVVSANVLFFFVLIWRGARSLNRTDEEREQLWTQEQAATNELLRTRAEAERTIESINDAFCSIDRDWRFTYVNKRAAEMFKRPADEFIGEEVWATFPESETQFRPDFERAMQTQQPAVLEAYYEPFQRWLEIRLHPSPESLSVFFHDITKRKHAADRLKGQKQTLEMVARGEPLQATLDALLLFLESQAPDMICTILLLDETGQRLEHGAAPSMPEEYTRAIDGAPIGPQVGSCGTALYRREPVFVADIATDPLWAEFKHLALPHGLKACWSTPIFDPLGQILGTFAIYHRTTGLPTENHRELIDMGTHISAICIARQRSQEALSLSEERYARAVHGTSDGIWDWDIRTNAEYLSPRWKALLGFQDDELPSHADSFYGRLHPDDIATAHNALQAHLEQRKVYDLEIRLRTKNDDYRWFRTRGQAEWDEQGQPVRMAGSLSDINIRKKTQDALERERAQATTVLNSLSSHIAVVDRDGLIVAVNEAWLNFAHENQAGNSNTVLVGANYLRIVEKSAKHDPFAQAALHGIKQVLEGRQKHFELEYPCNAPNERRQFLMIVTALKNGDGAVLAHENITERALAQEALLDSSEFNRQIIAGAHEGIVVLDRDLRYTVWNPFMVELLGLPASEVLGRHPTELFPWVKEGGQLAAMERALQGETIVLPDSQRLKTGAKRISWLHARLTPMRGANREITGVIVTIADITVRKLAELELRKSHAQLRALAARIQSVREEQSAQIAREIHDVLGQQLTALKLDLTWLKRRMSSIDNEPLKTTLNDKVVTSVELVDETIKTVQKVATELRPGLLDNLGLSAALEYEVRSFAERTGLDYQLDLEPGPLPIDQSQAIDIFRVCQELLTNIARHADAHHISVRLFRHEDYLHLEVIDDGRGISEHQLAAAKSLGLLGMKERAQLLGGTLDIRGSHDKGTLAQLTIPITHTRENSDR